MDRRARINRAPTSPHLLYDYFADGAGSVVAGFAVAGDVVLGIGFVVAGGVVLGDAFGVCFGVASGGVAVFACVAAG